MYRGELILSELHINMACVYTVWSRQWCPYQNIPRQELDFIQQRELVFIKIHSSPVTFFLWHFDFSFEQTAISEYTCWFEPGKAYATPRNTHHKLIKSIEKPRDWSQWLVSRSVFGHCLSTQCNFDKSNLWLMIFLPRDGCITHVTLQP